jgi:hypothetical protein
VGSDLAQVTHQRLWGQVSMSRPPINANELARSCLLAVIIPSLLTRELFKTPRVAAFFLLWPLPLDGGQSRRQCGPPCAVRALHSMLELQMPRYFIQVGECAHRTTHAAQWPIA